MNMASPVPEFSELLLIQQQRRCRTERGLAKLLRNRTPKALNLWSTWKCRFFQRLQHRLLHRVDLP